MFAFLRKNNWQPADGYTNSPVWLCGHFCRILNLQQCHTFKLFVKKTTTIHTYHLSSIVSLTVLLLDLPPTIHCCLCEIQRSLCWIFILGFISLQYGTHTNTHARKKNHKSKKKGKEIGNEVSSSPYVDPSVKQRKIICLRKTTQTTSKQALPPFNALFMENRRGRRCRWWWSVWGAAELCVQYCLWCPLCIIHECCSVPVWLTYCISAYKTHSVLLVSVHLVRVRDESNSGILTECINQCKYK